MFDPLDLHRRYDGPIPHWERPAHADSGRRALRRLLSFDRRMARLYGETVVASLRRASATAGAARMGAWNDALRGMDNWRFHRRSHAMLACRQELGRTPAETA